MIAEERESSSAQIRTCLWWAKKNDCRRVLRENFSSRTPCSSCRTKLYRETHGVSKRIFVKFINEILQRWRNCKKIQSSIFDTLTRQKFIEDQNTILELSGRLQELQNEVHCMNDSQDFQDADSVPVFFPPHRVPGEMLSISVGMPRRREGSPSIGDTHGILGNVFAHPVASSSALYPQESMEFFQNIHPSQKGLWKMRIKRPFRIRDASRTVSQEFSHPQWGRFSQELWSRPTTTADFGSCWKIRFKTEVCSCSQFPTEAIHWIKEVELVESVDELRTSSYSWYFNARFWSIRHEDCFSTEQNHT